MPKCRTDAMDPITSATRRQIRRWFLDHGFEETRSPDLLVSKDYTCSSAYRVWLQRHAFRVDALAKDGKWHRVAGCYYNSSELRLDRLFSVYRGAGLVTQFTHAYISCPGEPEPLPPWLTHMEDGCRVSRRQFQAKYGEVG